MKRILLTLVSLLTISASSHAGDWRFDISVGDHGHRPIRHHPYYIVPAPIVVYHHPPVVREVVRYHYVTPVVRTGHWEWVETQEWVPGYNENVWVPAVYEEMWVHARPGPHGEYVPAHSVRILVSEGHYESVWHEGYYKTVQKRVWVE